MRSTNVTPRLGSRPGPMRTSSKGFQLVVWAVVVIAIVLVLKGCVFHENAYEKIASGLTQALQNNDVAAVQKYQNAETATEINRGVVGRAADTLAPLGKIKSVKETTAKDAAPRVHDFTITFAKGTVREMMKLDPQDKIVAFHYEKIAQ